MRNPVALWAPEDAIDFVKDDLKFQSFAVPTDSLTGVMQALRSACLDAGATDAQHLGHLFAQFPRLSPSQSPW
jgi:hypothetical protein